MKLQHLALGLLVASLAARATLADSPASALLNKPDAWFKSDEAARIAASILSYQSDLGGWPKNTDTASAPYTGDRAKLKPTFDNGATTDELRFLARMRQLTGDARYEQAFLKGYDYILKAQYPTGGWPQFYPPSAQYHRHITFNDGSMVRLMEFLREVHGPAGASPSDRYRFVDEPRKQAGRDAFGRGIQCILKCQIKIDGKLTAWCAQHDEIDLSPRPARTYELASLSGSESVGIMRLLMSLDKPSPEIIASVQAAAEWFQLAQLQGIKVVEVADKAAPKGKDRRIVQDPAAPPMWARFYDIRTNRPIFCDRDGIPKPSLSDIGYERRNGYSWLGYYPQSLLAHDYPAWKARWLP